MKKLIALLLTLVLALGMLTACTSSSSDDEIIEEEVIETEAPVEETVDPVDVSVMGMTGPTTMGMVYMMNENDNGNLTDNNYTFSIAASIDEVTPKIVTGEVSIAAVPANVASALYNSTEGGVQVLAINTLGVLYIVENGETISSIADLEGKTIYASGKGGTPEYALNYILAANGLTDSVTVEWKSEQAEVVAALAADESVIAMLPQPFATTAMMSNENIRTALDLTEEWNNTDSEGMLITGVTVVNTAWAEENPEAIEAFLVNYETSVNFVNENLEEAAALVDQYGIVGEAVALQALPYCSITFIAGTEMQEALSGYLAELFAQEPSSIGGAMPADDFYYVS